MSKVKVLLVDDDLLIGSVITMSLQENGYDVHYQTSVSGLKDSILDFQPNVIVLDVEIGADNGIDAVPMIRMVDPGVPVIFISSHVETDMISRAIISGAEVYLKKPFDTQELITYVQKHTSKNTPTIILFGNSTINVNTRLLTTGGEDIKLSATECRLLRMLAINKNFLVTRKDIERTVFKAGEPKENSNNGDICINNLIVRLRKLIAKDPAVTLETKRSVGYTLICE